MNTVLKQGDLVKYHIESNALNDLGFILGQFYEVKAMELQGKQCLAIETPDDEYIHLSIDSVLTDNTDHFAKHVCPITLPKGKVS